MNVTAPSKSLTDSPVVIPCEPIVNSKSPVVGVYVAPVGVYSIVGVEPTLSVIPVEVTDLISIGLL